MKILTFTVTVLLSAPVLSQSIVPVLIEDQPTSDGFTVQFLNEIVTAGGGSWIAEVNTTNPDTGADDLLYRDGAVFLTPGDPLPGVPGDTVDFFNDVDHAGPGLTAYTARAVSAGIDVIVLEDSAIAREGDAVPTFLGLPAGTTWERLELVQVSPNGRVAVPGSVQIPGMPALTKIVATFDTDASHQVTGGVVNVIEGMPLSNGNSASFVFTANNESRGNSAGDFFWWGFDSAGGLMAINATVVAEEGGPTPEPGLSWGNFAGPELDLNDSGQWVTRSRVSSFPRDVVMASTGLVARQGQSHPAYPSFTAGDFGVSAPVFIANDGTVAFYVDLSGTGSTADDEAIVVGDQIVAREGVTQVGGQTIVEISESQRAFHYAKDGASLIFEGVLDDNGTLREADFLITFGLGQAYCIAELNSTGQAAAIAASGSASAAANDLTLMATGLPLNAFGFFLVSQTQGFAPLAGGSQGNLCLGGSIGRYQNQASSSGATGSISLQVNLTAIASPTGPYAGMPGTVLNFQSWYRDANPSVTSNFTNAVSVTLQ